MRWIIGVILVLWTSAATAEVRVVDGDTLKSGDITYRLFGIDAPERGQTCLDGKGQHWECGAQATKALAKMLRGKNLTCRAIEQDRYGRTVATCHADGLDLSSEMVATGMAWAFTKYSEDYVVEEFKARAENRGIWQGAAQPAWLVREKAWDVAKELSPNGCPIKGNISNRGKIYHMPWSKSYRKTRISEAHGERWFCDEAEAIAAGWRRAR